MHTHVRCRHRVLTRRLVWVKRVDRALHHLDAHFQLPRILSRALRGAVRCCAVLCCSYTVPCLHLLGVRGLARPRKSYQGAGPDEASSRRSLFATEQPWTAGWPRPKGWALHHTSHRIASRRTAQHRILPQCAPRASAAALRARVLYEYIHETDSRHDGRRTLTCSEHGTVDHSTSGLALSASSARLPAQHTYTYSQPALMPIFFSLPCWSTSQVWQVDR